MLARILTIAAPAAALFALEDQTLVSAENNTRLFGLVLLSNVIGSAVTIVRLGFKVGAARKVYNVPYPTMYAMGDSDEAKAFNSIQRGHQQALETHHIFLALSLIAGTRFPVTTALAGVLYSVARVQWADLYKENPDNRYGSFFARHVWTPLIALLLGTTFLAGELLFGIHRGII